MMKTLQQAIAMLAISAAIAAGTAPAMAQGGCLTNRQIQQAIAQGRILPLADILSYAGIDPSADVLSVRVCNEGDGQLYYEVAVLDAYGNTENLVLNAVDGSQ